MEKREIKDLREIEYVMVTFWEDHWDKLIEDPDLERGTYFSESVIKDGIFHSHLPEKATTLFIKLTPDKKQIENSWIGISKDFSKVEINSKPAISFHIENLEQVICLPEFINYSIGWHLNKVTFFTIKRLSPGFFDQLEKANWQMFEIGCYYLLRLLGIHCIHATPQDENSGKEDGAFMIGNLAVLYDCTTKPDFLERKKRQIRNYIHELKTGEIEIGSSIHTLIEHNKQVWIITRNEQVRTLDTNFFIKDGGEIVVKEVPYKKLIEIFQKRLDENLDEQGLSKLLLMI